MLIVRLPLTCKHRWPSLKKNYSTAFSILQKALHKHPHAPSLLMNAGLIALRFRQFNQARGYFEQVLAKITDHPDALLHLAVVDALQKNYQAAEEKYQRLLSYRQKKPCCALQLVGVEISCTRLSRSNVCFAAL